MTDQQQTQQTIIKNNIQTIVLYSISMACAIGISNLFDTIFTKYFSYKSEIIVKLVYVLLLLILVIALAIQFNASNNPI